MDAPCGCIIQHSGVETTVDALQLPPSYRLANPCQTTASLYGTGSWFYYWGYGSKMTTEASTAEPLPRQRTSHSAFPIPSLHRPTTISDHMPGCPCACACQCYTHLCMAVNAALCGRHLAGDAMAATLVSCGKQAKSLRTLCTASPEYDPAEKPRTSI